MQGLIPMPPRPCPSEDFVVVIDPGHGGIDPGAFQGGIKEADLMLILGAELAVMLNAQDGVQRRADP